MTEREENNRKLAIWLGWKPSPGGSRIHSPACQRDEAHCNGKGPDFYTDEAANAMLLEKMRRPLFVSDWPGCEGWRVDIGVEPLEPLAWLPHASGGKLLGPTHADRKTAIVLAALQLIDKLGESR